MAQVNSVHPGNPINDPTQKRVHTSSKIPFVFRDFMTQRFGDIHPILGFEYVPKDDIEFKPEYDLRTYTLKSPLMSDLFYKQEFYSVDLQAILPKNWEKIYTNPLIGDDVANIVNSFVSGTDLRTLVYNSIFALMGINPSEEEPDPNSDFSSHQLRSLLFASMWFSQGSLLNQFGYCFDKLFYRVSDEVGQAASRNKFDLFFQDQINVFIDAVKSYLVRNSFDGFVVKFHNIGEEDDTYIVAFENLDRQSIYPVISFHRFLEMAYQNLNFTIPKEVLIFENAEEEIEVIPLMYDVSSGEPNWNLVSGSNWPDFNFGKIAAYQIICAHYYSNDHVDYIYSADLFKQLIWSYIMGDVPSDNRSFSYNGVLCEYDSFSGAMMLWQVLNAADVAGTSGLLAYKLAYWTALLSYRKSLRFVDYFTGGKASPLAVGNVNVAVNDNLVSVIDVTKNIQKQRYLNSVNRTGRKIQDYIQGIFGIAPDPDHHNPQWLAQTNDPVQLEEVDNTGAAQQTQQNSVTGVLRASNAQYAFRFQTALPGYLIGVSFFDIPRAYAHLYLRENMHADRFDMFNPDFQFIGDQDIKRSELLAGSNSEPWAYTLRNMEYKQRVDSCHGGFALKEVMPGYCFRADDVPGLPTPSHISPDYIRSKNSEMDEFFLSLTGYGLADYFHFQIKHVAIIDSDRPMAYAPSIL